eukprot:scaffold1698_cov149-Skeletonema_menzelii.AAC.32
MAKLAADQSKAATLLEHDKEFRAQDEDALVEQNLHSNSSEEGSLLSADKTTFDGTVVNELANPYHYVPLKMGGNGRTHTSTKASAALIHEIGGLPTLEQMTTHFYSNAFLDSTLDNFIRSHGDPHAERFARWIHQKLTGSSVWDEERASRSSRPGILLLSMIVLRHMLLRGIHPSVLRKKLVGISSWMNADPSFTDYYIRFIGHFINVYENTAPTFARDSARWSANPKNIQEYIDNGRTMNDVLGLTLGQALSQIPVEEADDNVWPYEML